MSRSRILAVATAIWLSAPAGTAAAEQQGVHKLEDIVVTAQKKEQSIQDVPMSISAVGGAEIVRNALGDLKGYGTRFPNLSFGATGESRNAATLAIAIRGVVGKGTTGFYIDETPVWASINPLVTDLERIEVLRGPQGTLYGARSMGGTVRLITRQPDLSEATGGVGGRLATTKGGGMSYRADGVVNIPVVPERFALRVLAYGQDQGGFIDRAPSPSAPADFATHRNVDDSRTYGGRITGLLSLLDGDLTIQPALAVEDTSWDGRSWADVSAGNRTNDRGFDIDEEGDSEWKLGSLTIRYSRPYGQFTSSTSYFDWSSHDTEDASEFLQLVFGPLLPGALHAEDHVRSFAQELRFSSRLEGPFQFTTGAFYQDSTKFVIFPPDLWPDPPADPILTVFSMRLSEKVQETALFAEATFDLTSNLALIGGARYFEHQLEFSSVQGGVFGSPIPFLQDGSESGVTPKFGLQYRFDEDRMLYATAAEGFRIGGVNLFPADVCADDLEDLGLTASELGSYDSDQLWSYEVGMRSRWPAHGVALSVAGYRIDWSDLQQTIGLSCGFPAFVNAGKAKIQGFEADLSLVAASGLALKLGVGYADSEITDNGGFGSVIVGAPVQNAPKWTASAALDYEFQAGNIPMFAHFDYSDVGQSLNARNSAPFFRVRPSYNVLNLRAGAGFGTWDVDLFVENVTDEKANLADVPPMAAEFPGRPRILVNRPRTIGMEVRARF
ncbi:MAG: TonB-dependent receptor [Gammaproteobacteria bacterium]|nr:MAG: TonB-dependent receptor [Gammaproteobacteria bacterium]